MRESTIFYKSFFDAGKSIKNKLERLKFYEAIFNYSLNGELSKLENVTCGMFELVKPQIEANLKRYENGKKGGKNSNQNETKTEPRHNQNETKTEPNGNKNDNVNVNVNGNDNFQPPHPNIEDEKYLWIPSFENVNEIFILKNGTTEMAQKFFEKWQSSNWMDGKRELKGWTNLVPSYITNWKNIEIKNNLNYANFKQNNTKSNEPSFIAD